MADRDSCLKRRLLFASVQVYHPDQPVDPADPRWRAETARTGNPGWTIAPTRVSGGSSTFLIPAGLRPQIDLALVGRFAEGIVVAFRGTLPPLDLAPNGKTITNPEILGLPVFLDWRNNLRTQLERGVRVGEATIPGAVHHGFVGSLTALWTGVAAEIDRLRGGDATPRLYFTGHSKGGALANLAALCARQIWPRATVRAATFGAPNAGDDAFAEAYLAAGIDCQRYTVAGDIVPDVPTAGFVAGELPGLRVCEPVGVPRPIDHIYYAVPGPVGFFTSLLPPRDDRSRLPPVVAAHLPYRGFGYGDNVCEPGCRHDWS